MPIVRWLPLLWHAVLDLVLVLFGFAAPFLFGYADAGLSAAYTWAVSAFGLLLNAVTDYPLGIVRVVPGRIHSLIEWTGPVVFIVGPWLLLDHAAARWALTAIGVISFATNAVTDWPTAVGAPATVARRSRRV